MQTAVGNIGGNPPVISERKTGATAPTVKPHCQPQINPQSNTGICIGQSIEPISGICPVRKGKTYAIAKNKAANIIFKTESFLFIFIFIFI
jgi:hypothetical protein